MLASPIQNGVDTDSINHATNRVETNSATQVLNGPQAAAITPLPPPNVKRRRRRRPKNGEVEDPEDEPKRRVVTTACIACRKRKSKCDGNTPACAACSQVYGTPCIYDPNSDHRRKGVYKRDIEDLKTKDTTLQTIVQAILNYSEEEIPALVRHIRTCDSLDDVAESITAKEYGVIHEDEDDDDLAPLDMVELDVEPSFESKLGTKMGELRLDDGSVRYIGGTSHLLFLNGANNVHDYRPTDAFIEQQDNPITSWTSVTTDAELISHLLNMYFTWHYSYFTCLSRSLFFRDFLIGRQPTESTGKTEYCTPLLVNAMLALGCHFTNRAAAREDPDDPTSAGHHFFREAKRLLLENDEHEKPKIATVQALALMSVREAGCGREARGWVYSGMSFRMACDMGLHLDSGDLAAGRDRALDEGEEDARRITFWGCFLFDKCWSNYMGRLPQLPPSIITCPRFDVFPDEDGGMWVPYSDSGVSSTHRQPARTRAVALHITSLCEISSDLMRYFYNPGEASDTAKQKGKQAELKKLSEIEIRLEDWRKGLPKEMDAREGALPSVFLMHMFFQLLFVHLFRPFLQYTVATSPLPPTVSPRKLCTTAATTISRILRLYKRSYGLRQICNISIYIIHTACTIHLLNLPDRDAKRDIIHGVKHLEEIAESWPGARRTLTILGALARQWNVELPDEAEAVLRRCESKFADDDDRSSASPAMLQPVQADFTPTSTDQAMRFPVPHQFSHLQQHTHDPRSPQAPSSTATHESYWHDQQGPATSQYYSVVDHLMHAQTGQQAQTSVQLQPQQDIHHNNVQHGTRQSAHDLFASTPQSVTELLDSLLTPQTMSAPMTPVTPAVKTPSVDGHPGRPIPTNTLARQPSLSHLGRPSPSTSDRPGSASNHSMASAGTGGAEPAHRVHAQGKSRGAPADTQGQRAPIANTTKRDSHNSNDYGNGISSGGTTFPAPASAGGGGGGGRAAGVAAMFGGVEQLLRDVGGGAAGEWMLRDQSALAWGFGNWDLAGPNGVAPAAATVAATASAPPSAAPALSSFAVPAAPSRHAGGGGNGALPASSIVGKGAAFSGSGSSVGGGGNAPVDMDLEWLR